jgi:putative ABC transport system permease protein
MTRPRWRKIFSDLWGHKLRSLLMVASITVGLFALGIIATFYLVISSDMQAGYAGANPANIQISLPPFPQELVDHLRTVEGVRQMEGGRRFSLRVKNSSDEWKAIDLRVIPEDGGMTINTLRLLRGRYPQAKDEIVVETNKLGELKADLGDWVTLEVTSNKTYRMKLVGVVNDQTVGTFSLIAGGFFMAPIQGYISEDALEKLGQPYPGLHNLLLVTVIGDGGDVDHIQTIANRITTELERVGYQAVNIRARGSTDHPNIHLCGCAGGNPSVPGFDGGLFE